MAIMDTDSGTGPKSAYELAMERLRKKDAEAGVERHVVTDEQKAAIADIRNFYEAKLAELEVSVQGKLRSMFDQAGRDALEDEYRRDRERLAGERDAKVAAARGAEP
jgi:methylaspartate ammonia-lyase